MLARMRILFCSTAGAGHVGPLLPIARTLAARGDEVRFLLPPDGRAAAAAAGFEVETAPEPEPRENADLWARVKADPKLTTVLVNRDYFGRLCTAATLPAALDLCRSWRPDLVLHEAAEYASAIAAHRCGIRHAQVAIGLARVEWGALHKFALQVLPDFEPGAADLFAGSPYLTRLPAVLDPSEYPRTLRYRSPDGAAAAPAPEGRNPAPEQGRAVGPRLYASLGSMIGPDSRWHPAYRVLLDAFTALERSRPDLGILLTVGRSIDPAGLGPVPGNTEIVSWVAQDTAFAEADLVLCHGGSGTAYGALAAGLPLVFFPLWADQPSNAELISTAGAGIAIDTRAAREGAALDDQAAGELRERLAREIAAAVEAVLDEPHFSARARELGAELRDLPSLESAIAGITV